MARSLRFYRVDCERWNGHMQSGERASEHVSKIVVAWNPSDAWNLMREHLKGEMVPAMHGGQGSVSVIARRRGVEE